jgi:hypothetical protein
VLVVVYQRSCPFEDNLSSLVTLFNPQYQSLENLSNGLVSKVIVDGEHSPVSRCSVRRRLEGKMLVKLTPRLQLCPTRACLLECVIYLPV